MPPRRRGGPAASFQLNLGVRPRQRTRKPYAAVSLSTEANPVALRYLSRVSPTVLRVAGYRFYFFSREETRPHVHVQHATGEAKFWVEPRIELALNHGLSAARLATAQRLVKEHRNAIRAAWKTHFGR